ncbi:MAG: hypothetical protein ABSG82_00730 [Sedimentisphaerales bacterium]|jgi:hypothetical protein
MNWYKISLTTDQVTDGKIAEIQDKFLEVFMISKNREELVLFASSKFEVQNFTELYFTPECYGNPAMKIIITQNNGKPCEKPELRGLALLVGYAKHAKELL